MFGLFFSKQSWKLLRALSPSLSIFTWEMSSHHLPKSPRVPIKLRHKLSVPTYAVLCSSSVLSPGWTLDLCCSLVYSIWLQFLHLLTFSPGWTLCQPNNLTFSGPSYQHPALPAIFRCCWSVPHLQCSHHILSHRANILLLLLPKKAT